MILPDPWGNQARGQYAVLNLADHEAAKSKTLRVRPGSARRGADQRAVAEVAMEGLSWALLTHDRFLIAWPLCLSLAVGFLLVQSDFVGLLIAFFARLAVRGRPDAFVKLPAGARPSGLVIIPSLLRNRGDFTAITTTVASCADNGYPGELVVVVSVDGRTEKPELYRELAGWLSACARPVTCPSTSAAPRHASAR